LTYLGSVTQLKFALEYSSTLGYAVKSIQKYSLYLVPYKQ